MLTAYLDDSGIHAGAPYCVVAGFVAGKNPWKQLESRWRQLLDENGLTDFHAKDFFKRAGPFHKWEEERFHSFLDTMMAAIRGVKLSMVGLAVDVAHFEQQTERARRFATGAAFDVPHRRRKTTGAPSKPYFTALLWCFYQALEPAKQGIVVDFVCDRQQHFEGLAHQLFDECKRLTVPPYKDHMGTLTFAPRTDSPGLQLADLAAHVVYRYSDAAYGEGAIPEEMAYVSDQLHLRGIQEVRLLDHRAWWLFEAVVPQQVRDLVFSSNEAVEERR